MCLVIIFAECVSGTKAGDAEAHSPSAEGLTAYRYDSTYVSIITVKVGICNRKVDSS